jgi:hypothetical protein
MTEQQWLNCTDPLEMLEFLGKSASSRKLRLYACADCRRKWSWYDRDEISRQCVEAAERYANGAASASELAAANQAMQNRGWFTEAFWTTEADAGSGAWAVAHHIVESASQSMEGDQIAATAKAEELTQIGWIRDIFGNPFRPAIFDPAWRTAAVLAVSQTMYAERRFADMPILADALEEAGCTSAEILDHCRSGQEHARGCWVVDLILKKE